jgi:subtilisin family serine protease
MDLINAPDAWDVTTGSKEIYVAVIDTGIQADHPDLSGNLDVTRSKNFTDDPDIADGVGHGTHVSGTVGAVGNNKEGVVGVNWTTNIIALKVFDKDGRSRVSAVMEAVNEVVRLIRDENINIKAVNLSLGSYISYKPDSYEILNSPEYRAYKILDNLNKAVIVVAAGNDSFEVGAPAPVEVRLKDGSLSAPKGSYVYPASYVGLNNLIVVGSVDADKSASDFSNWSSKYVHLAAPGGYTAYSKDHGIYSTFPGGQYVDSEGGSPYSGTSMAAPHVTGAAVLLASKKGNEFLSANELKSQLLITASSDVRPDSKSIYSEVNATDKKLSIYGLLDVGASLTKKQADIIKSTGITARAPAKVTVDGEFFLAFDVTPDTATDKSLTWSSSSPAVASVDGNGYVRALSAGKTTITATAKDSGVTGSVELTVSPPVIYRGGGGDDGGKGMSGGGCDAGVSALGVLFGAAILAVKKRAR